MQVAVRARRGSSAPGPGVGRGLGFEPREVLGHLAGERLLDDPAAARTDAGEILDAPLRRELAQLVERNVADRVGGAAERLFLVAAGAPALEEGRDAVECLDRIHRPRRYPLRPTLARYHGGMTERPKVLAC